MFSLDRIMSEATISSSLPSISSPVKSIVYEPCPLNAKNSISSFFAFCINSVNSDNITARVGLINILSDILCILSGLNPWLDINKSQTLFISLMHPASCPL